MSKKNKKTLANDEPIVLDIPEEEIWTYQVEGLAPPHINKPYKHYTLKKIIFALVIIVAVGLSCYFSVRTVQKDTFEYKALGGSSYQLSKFSNTGYITELYINNTSTLIYDETNGDPETNYTIKDNVAENVISIREYAFNCDEKIQIIHIGANVTEIDSKAFYSCWNLRCVYVDEDNPNYCDIDGVLYNKDKTELIFYPVNHDEYLNEKYGFTQWDDKGNWIELAPGDEGFEQYKKDVLTYIIPSTVTKIGDLAMNYVHLEDVYMPEGITEIGTLAFFKSSRIQRVITYKCDEPVMDTHFTDRSVFTECYNSLPEGLVTIGSDAFSYDQALTYVYIPSSVTHIGHHAFWDTVYKKDGQLQGVSAMNVALSEDEFHDKTETGDQWRPQYDYMLFKKTIDTNYSAQRAPLED